MAHIGVKNSSSGVGIPVVVTEVLSSVHPTVGRHKTRTLVEEIDQAHVQGPCFVELPGTLPVDCTAPWHFDTHKLVLPRGLAARVQTFGLHRTVAIT